MTNSFLLGEALKSLFSSSSDLINIIGEKVFPLVANEGTEYPFIVYQRTDTTSNGCKDGFYEDNVIFNIRILSETYSESIEIAHLVRKLLEKQRITIQLSKITEEKMVFDNCYVNGVSEEYSNGVYIQTINFNTHIH